MKKKILSVVILLTLTISALCLISCGKSNGEKIEQLNEDIQKGNFTIEATMENVPFFGTVTRSLKIDGSKEWYSAMFFDGEYYIERTDGAIYKYKKNDGVWTKETVDSSEKDNTASGDIFKKDYFDKTSKSNVYNLKKDAWSGVIEGTLTFNKDGACLKYSQNSDGVVLNYTVNIIDIGTTKVTLPTV